MFTLKKADSQNQLLPIQKHPVATTENPNYSAWESCGGEGLVLKTTHRIYTPPFYLIPAMPGPNLHSRSTTQRIFLCALPWLFPPLGMSPFQSHSSPCPVPGTPKQNQVVSLAFLPSFSQAT